MDQRPDVFVTNFNPNFTGVSATAAGVLRAQAKSINVALVGQPLPGCPASITPRAAWGMCRLRPKDKPFHIWHVRRNPEMRTAIWARDVRRLPIKIVFTSAAQRKHSIYPRWLISRMDAVIATTQEAASFVPHVKAVIPHGIDTERFHPATDRELSWSQSGFPGKAGIAAIGRIRPEKGTDLFVEVMLKLLPSRPDLTALVIGRAGRSDASFLDALKARVLAAGLSDRLIFTGEIGAEKMPELVRSLSVLVALPRYEGYGMTPLEAMASGVPFVASDTGYFRAFSGNETGGKIVSLGEIDSALVEIAELIDTPSKLKKMSQSALKIVQDSYDISGEAAAINEVYEQLWREGGA
jgi:mannosyltransferase